MPQDPHLVLAMSTGMEAAVVTNPLIMLAQKWHRMLSWKYPGGEAKAGGGCCCCTHPRQRRLSGPSLCPGTLPEEGAAQPQQGGERDREAPKAPSPKLLLLLQDHCTHTPHQPLSVHPRLQSYDQVKTAWAHGPPSKGPTLERLPVLSLHPPTRVQEELLRLGVGG